MDKNANTCPGIASEEPRTVRGPRDIVRPGSKEEKMLEIMADFAIGIAELELDETQLLACSIAVNKIIGDLRPRGK